MTGANGRLPDGWVTTTLGDVRLDLSRSIDPRKSGAEMFELYSVPSFSDRRPEIVSGDTVGSSKRTVEPNSVLLCKINPRINRVWVVRDYSQHRKIASTEWLCFSELSGLFPDFLCYCLQQDSFRDYLATNASGVGGSLMRVRDTTFADYPFPLPPLPEQHRIVAEIEKQFTRLDASVAALKRVQANLKRYRASVLKAACEGKLVPTEAELTHADGRDYEPADRLLERVLAERRARWKSQEKRRGKYKEPVAPDTLNLPELPAGWVWATADQLILDSPQNGIYRPKSQYGDGVPVVRIEDYQDFHLRDREQLQRLKITTEEASTYGLAASQLIINRVNSPSHLGKTLLVPDHLPPAVFESNMMKVIPSKCTDPSFFAHYLRSPVGRARLTTQAKWAVNQASINQSDVCSTPVPLPPLAEQRRIVAEVERRLSVVQQAEAAVEANLARAERLRQSILKQAFSGQLVPQDPDDEPASVLLERIRAERETAQAAAKSDRKPKRRRPKKTRERQHARREGAS